MKPRKQGIDLVSRTLAVNKLKAARFKAEGNLSCEACGYTPPRQFAHSVIEGHHLRCVADGGNHDSENILLLCANCHRLEHYLFSVHQRRLRCPTREEVLLALRDPGLYITKQSQRTVAIIEEMTNRP